MAYPTISPFASSLPEPAVQPLLAFQQAFFTGVLQLQQLQLEMMMTAWQRPFGAASKEMWDVWVAHFGGGVPIDA